VRKFVRAMELLYTKRISTALPARCLNTLAQESKLPVKSCPPVPKVAWKKTGQLQRTISRGFTKAGVGLHSGDETVVRVLPAMAGEGRYFILDNYMVRVPASTMYVTDTTLSVSIGKGSANIGTVEHLLSALEGMGIDNCRIELEGGNEPPFHGYHITLLPPAQGGAAICIACQKYAFCIKWVQSFIGNLYRSMWQEVIDGSGESPIDWILKMLHGDAFMNCQHSQVPLLDGSSLEWVDAIEEAGTCIARNNFGMDVEKMALVVCEPFHVFKGESFVVVVPAPSTRITYGIDFPQA
ncbi:hypothetical protein KI387_024610, partial [Taxus chinensis]